MKEEQECRERRLSAGGSTVAFRFAPPPRRPQKISSHFFLVSPWQKAVSSVKRAKDDKGGGVRCSLWPLLECRAHQTAHKARPRSSKAHHKKWRGLKSSRPDQSTG